MAQQAVCFTRLPGPKGRLAEAKGSLPFVRAHGIKVVLPSACEGFHHGLQHLWVHMSQGLYVLQSEMPHCARSQGPVHFSMSCLYKHMFMCILCNTHTFQYIDFI